MKTIDVKSLIIGVLAAVLGFGLMSNSPQEEATALTISGHPAGILIYNPNTKELYKYDFVIGGKLATSPKNIYSVSPDGSKLTEE